MAKPIQATPQLKGKEAKEFIKKMIAREKEKITINDIDRYNAINNAALVSLPEW